MPGSRIVPLPLVAGLRFTLAVVPSRTVAPGAASTDLVFISQQVKDEVANNGRTRVI